MTRPTIAVTLGDPAGIGPEVAWKALQDEEIRAIAHWVIFGEAWIAQELDQQYGALSYGVVSQPGDADQADGVTVVDRGMIARHDRTIGQVSAPCGAAALDYVRSACEFCLDGGAAAIVTGPLNKEAVALGGISFTGHTEYLAELCGVEDSRMLLCNDTLRVVHVTTHMSLVEATRVSSERVFKTIQLGHEALVRMGWEDPEIAVCGLNPHAGENGMFGSEETDSIIPAIERAKSCGMNCLGPLPADALFVQATRGKHDLVVAMYHDQGCIPMKVFDFDNTVNVTLGLPIVRTSVDHGTAFDIAGKHQADAQDMKAAMRLAVKMSENAAANSTLCH